MEGVFSIQMSVAAFIVHAIQGDPYVGRGTWQSSGASVRAVQPSWSCSPALPSCQMRWPFRGIAISILGGSFQKQLLVPPSSEYGATGSSPQLVTCPTITQQKL